MPRPFSLGNPAPGHYPTVGRAHTGNSWSGGRFYATTLSCGCGWRAGRVSNEAPSAGGRSAAQGRYREHLVDVGVIPLTPLPAEPDPGCYPCKGTSKVVGFGQDGKPCPACTHDAECSVERGCIGRGCPIYDREHGP